MISLEKLIWRRALITDSFMIIILSVSFVFELFRNILFSKILLVHYDSLAFSKNGFETMVAKQSEMTAVIGAAIDFSPVNRKTVV